MIKTMLIVGFGGFLGSISRYLLARYVEQQIISSFPYGTFTVNLVGCFLIGILYGFAIRNLASPEMRLLIGTGFCGSLTTFSAFSHELLGLLQDGQIYYSLSYAAGSVVTGFLTAWLGVFLIKSL